MKRFHQRTLIYILGLLTFLFYSFYFSEQSISLVANEVISVKQSRLNASITDGNGTESNAEAIPRKNIKTDANIPINIQSSSVQLNSSEATQIPSNVEKLDLDDNGTGNKSAYLPPTENTTTTVNIPVNITSVPVQLSFSKFAANIKKKAKQGIPMNTHSSFVESEVSRIIHSPSESRIEVHLKPTRRCKNPLLKGRISGWSLSMIEFDNITDDKVIGHYDLYHIPVSGTYHVEILVVSCEKYEGDYRSMNLREPCLEIKTDASHQLTAGNGIDEKATIYLEVPSDRNDTSHDENIMGRWLHHSLLSDEKTLLDENKILQLPQPLPVFTPHEGGSIWCQLGNKEAYCDIIGTDARALLYTNYTYYQWDPRLSEVWRKDYLTGFLNSDYIKDDQTKVCFVGASHSREFANGCNRNRDKTAQLAKEHGLDDSLFHKLQCAHIDTRIPALDGYPEQIPETSINLIMSDKVNAQIEQQQCTHAVVGLFQWYFSYENKIEWKKEITFNEWKAGMIRTVKMLQDSSQSPSSSLRKIYLRSAHANGFSSAHVACPPDDFRTPINAKIATEIVEEIVEEFNSSGTNTSSVAPVSFLDTSLFVDGIWDSAGDWSHFNHVNLEMESKFVLSKILIDDL